MLIVALAICFQAEAPLVPLGNYEGDIFIYEEQTSLYGAFVNQLVAESATSILDSAFENGTLMALCILQGVNDDGYTPYPYIAAKSSGNAQLLNPFTPFNLVQTYNWVVATGVIDFFPPGNKNIFVNNLDLHAVDGGLTDMGSKGIGALI